MGRAIANRGAGLGIRVVVVCGCARVTNRDGSGMHNSSRRGTFMHGLLAGTGRVIIGDSVGIAHIPYGSPMAD